MKTCIYLMVWLIGYATPLSAQLHAQQLDYLQQHKDLAIREMLRTGIPASIILAHALLESGAGQYELTQSANNHFGLRCGDDWAGPAYSRLAYSTEGKPGNACYRAYPNAAASFRDYSNFITDPTRIGRYRMLFKLATTDYYGWASGLQLTGLVTGNSYAQKLVWIIENYGLHRYDAIFYMQSSLPERYWPEEALDSEPRYQTDEESAFQSPSVENRPEYGYQRAPTAKTHTESGLMALREVPSPRDRDDSRFNRRGPAVSAEPNYRPVPTALGIQVVNRNNGSRYRSNTGQEDAGFDQDRFQEDVKITPTDYFPNRSLQPEKSSIPVKRSLVRTVYHKVGKSETLSSIARSYGTTVKQLLWWNGLGNDQIRYGQLLQVS